MNNRKKTRGRNTQTIVESKTIVIRDKWRHKKTVPNPRAGKSKQIRHMPNPPASSLLLA